MENQFIIRIYTHRIQDQTGANFKHAHAVEENLMLQTMQQLAKDLNLVLPISFFEKSNNSHFNSLIMIDADGTLMDIYRKSHIPDGPGYQEKFYFTPGDTGFKVWETKYATIGCGICWDQWYLTCFSQIILLYRHFVFC